MSGETNIVLELDKVSRLYPRDISDTSSAVLREMLLPRRLVGKPGPDYVFALFNVNLRLHAHQKLGVIGTHRSGKTNLAGIASGLLQPTSGNVSAPGSRLLISRPSAGFKPTLTLIENLRLRASLAGLRGDGLEAVLDRTLSLSGLSPTKARLPVGNLSPYIVKQLGLILLLSLDADTLIVDEISSAGAGDARWVTRGLMLEKIQSNAAIVISSDLRFIQEVAKQAVLLHEGRLYGPFSVEQAIDHFKELPKEGFSSVTNLGNYDPLIPPKSSVLSAAAFSNSPQDSDLFDGLSDLDVGEGNDEESFPSRGKLEIKRMWSPLARLVEISVDGSPYSRSRYSLIRGTQDTLNLELTIIFKKNCFVSDFIFCLHPELGEEVARTRVPVRQQEFTDGSTYTLLFSIEIPELPVNSYRLSITPIESNSPEAITDRMKVLKFGLLGKRSGHNRITMKISTLTINP